jgi:putative endonuclease
MDPDKALARARRGRLGEAMAALFLEARGWTIEARNFRAGRHEIDLVARRGRTLALVEVKWRAAHAPAEAAPGAGAGAGAGWSPAQRGRAAAAAWDVVRAFDPGRACAVRFDLVAIDEHPRGLVLEHRPGVWTPGHAWW